MTALVPSEPPRQPVYLDRPQLLGVVPTFGFWNQREVWRLVGAPVGGLMAVWSVAIGAGLSGLLPIWALALIGALGFMVIVGLLERYVRRRMRARALAAARAPAEPPGA